MKEHLFTFNFSLSLVQETYVAREPRWATLVIHQKNLKYTCKYLLSLY